MNLVLRRQSNNGRPSSSPTQAARGGVAERGTANNKSNGPKSDAEEEEEETPLSSSLQPEQASMKASNRRGGKTGRKSPRGRPSDTSTARNASPALSLDVREQTGVSSSPQNNNRRQGLSPRSNKSTSTSPISRFSVIKNKRVGSEDGSGDGSNPNTASTDTTAATTTAAASRRRPHGLAFLRPCSPSSTSTTAADPSNPDVAAPSTSASTPVATTTRGRHTANPKSAPHRIVSTGNIDDSGASSSSASGPRMLRRGWSAPLRKPGEKRAVGPIETASSPSLLDVPEESSFGPAASSVSTSSTNTSSSCHHAGGGQQEEPAVTSLSQTKKIIQSTNTPPHEDDVKASSSTPALLDEENELAVRQQPLLTHKLAACSAATILPHSYLERLCGPRGGTADALVNDENDVDNVVFPSIQDGIEGDFDDGEPTDHLCSSSGVFQVGQGNGDHMDNMLPDDPTVQESIECVFASQLKDGLMTILFQEEQDSQPGDDEGGDLLAPSVLQQCLLPNRSGPKKKLSSDAVQLVHVETYDPSTQPSSPSKMATRTEKEPRPTTTCRASSPSGRCACGQQTTPILDRQRWPQWPLLLRPTPGSGTRITAIRTMSQTLWDAHRDGPSSNLTWPAALHQTWGNMHSKNVHFADEDTANPMEVMCPQCMVLPINNGNEEPGEVLLTDFESDLFVGTLLLRVRHAEGTTREKYTDAKGYFKGMNRRYQAVIRGRFKKEIPLTQCMTGFELQRECGKLPPKWILNGSLKVLSFFAPQLQAKLDGEQPSSLTPLGSTPQVLAVHDESNPNITPMEGVHLEPTRGHETLLGRASDAESSFARARLRKKQFDKLFIQKSTTPTTDLSKVYTFEFLQHLFNFANFEIELGSMLGAISLEPILNGQPLQIMAVHQNSNVTNKSGGSGQRLWSFDVWHESLIDQALQYEAASSPSKGARQSKRE